MYLEVQLFRLIQVFEIPVPSELRVTVSSAESSPRVSKHMLHAPEALSSQLETH